MLFKFRREICDLKLIEGILNTLIKRQVITVKDAQKIVEDATYKGGRNEKKVRKEKGKGKI